MVISVVSTVEETLVVPGLPLLVLLLGIVEKIEVVLLEVLLPVLSGLFVTIIFY